ncbi:hypothetical protein BVI1335_320129 [Burkholderia vietnamiensis]|nr:hypothetical protein BVI1335_320129 [Burkholderia vietnamiensis]
MIDAMSHLLIFKLNTTRVKTLKYLLAKQ